MAIEKEIKGIEELLVKKQKDYDKVSEMSRDMIRNAASAITLLHNDRFAEAESTIKKMKVDAKSLAGCDPQLKYYSVQALQEYAEAVIFHSLKMGKGISSRESLAIDIEPYLLGMMDVVGELKREVLEALRKPDIKEADRYYSLMKEIYDSTSSIRFAEAILNGFRRKQDVARIQLESAGSEILFAKKRS
jgi:translin